MIYLDNAASMPVNPKALEEAMPFLADNFANSSSIHTPGREGHLAIQKARERCAAALNADPDEIIFTSGGTESNNLAVFSAALSSGKRRIITSAIEHPSVLMPCAELEKRGFEIIKINPDRQGIINIYDLEKALNSDTALVTIMTANNEVGTLQPVAEAAELCRERYIPFHTDAVQAAGNIPINLRELKADYLSISAHKIGGFKGSGLLFARRGATVRPLIFGGGQEHGLRSGTENTAAIAALGAAMEYCCRDIQKKERKISRLRDMLIEKLSRIPNSHLNGSTAQRLCGNVNISFEGVESEPLVLSLDLMGVCVSAASACSAGKQARSHVLKAMGLSENIIDSSVRLTLSEYNTESEILKSAEIITDCINKLRSI